MKWRMEIAGGAYNFTLYAENEAEGRILELASKKEALTAALYRPETYSNRERPEKFSLTICCRDKEPEPAPEGEASDG